MRNIGYTFSLFFVLSNHKPNFLNSQLFNFLMCFSYLSNINGRCSELCKVSRKKYLNISHSISCNFMYLIFFWCRISNHISNFICLSKHRSYLQSICYLNLCFQANYWDKGYALPVNISLHIYQNPCIRSATDIQYKLSLL